MTLTIEDSLKKLDLIEDEIDYLVELCREYRKTHFELEERVRELKIKLGDKAEAESRQLDGSMKLQAQTGGLLARLDAYRSRNRSS